MPVEQRITCKIPATKQYVSPNTASTSAAKINHSPIVFRLLFTSVVSFSVSLKSYPQSEQNFPFVTAPQFGQTLASSNLTPHSLQNSLPSGLFAPQFLQIILFLLCCNPAANCFTPGSTHKSAFLLQNIDSLLSVYYQDIDMSSILSKILIFIFAEAYKICTAKQLKQ